MKEIKLVIDIGSKYTIISQIGKGVVIKEPSLALLETNKKKIALVECGNAALKYVGALTPAQQLLYPIKDGTIFHERAAVLMYRSFIQRLLPNVSILKSHIKAIACVACGATNTEKKEIEKVLTMAGVSETVIIEAPIAINCALDENSCRMIVDIGAAKTDVAVVAKDGIVTGCTIGIGGDSFNQAIMDYMSDARGVRLSSSKIEKIKKQIGSLYENDTACLCVDVSDIASNQTQECKIYARDIKNALIPLIDKIVDVIYNLTFQIPENIAEEVYLNGIAICGGSSYLAGIIDYISVAIKMQAYQVENPSIIAGIGGMKFFENEKKLASIFNIANF